MMRPQLFAFLAVVVEEAVLGVAAVVAVAVVVLVVVEESHWMILDPLLEECSIFSFIKKA